MCYEFIKFVVTGIRFTIEGEQYMNKKILLTLLAVLPFMAFTLQKIEIPQRLEIGAIAPDFTQNDQDGKPVSLSSFRGKYVLIDFWASLCGPCRHENPNLVAAYKEFKDKGFTILGVSLDRETGRDAWLKAIENDQLPWTQVSDLKYWNNEVAELYGIRSIPQSYL